MSRIITLTTDFGHRDPFVGIMKGVIAAIDPAATVVDLTHGVAPQDVTGGALALAAAVDYFPAGTVHLAVVDPGVGSARRAILIETDRAFYVGPDNGILRLAADRQRMVRAVRLSNPAYHLRPTSSTFHGRDVFAPVAAHVSLGAPPERLGETVEACEELILPKPERDGEGRMVGEVIHIDGFGNLTTNIRRRDLEPFGADGVSFRIGDRVIRGLSASYAEAGPGNYLAIVNSWELLEISRCNGSAESGLGARVGDRVSARPSTPLRYAQDERG